MFSIQAVKKKTHLSRATPFDELSIRAESDNHKQGAINGVN